LHHRKPRAEPGEVHAAELAASRQSGATNGRTSTGRWQLGSL
jgi:hypothetical protein